MESENSSGSIAAWPWYHRVAFRFFCTYFVLYILPFPLRELTTVVPVENFGEFLFKWLLEPYRKGWDAVVLWVGQHLFGVEITIRPGGSGDTTWNYVQVFCFLVIAIVITLVWSLIDHRRRNYARLHEWLRVYVRFYVASVMILYGSIKVIKSQFPFPDGDRLLVPYGESSPMRLLWTFMGVSEGCNWFTGAGEMLGGILLCFRRTTLLGALITFGVMLHVSALNYCYDVPVKLFSTHLVVMAVFLMIPDMRWLFGVFVMGRRTEYPGVVPLTQRRWLNITLMILRTAIVGAYVGFSLYNAQKSREVFGDLAPRPPLYGLWEVEEFESDGTAKPAVLNDTERWRFVSFSKKRNNDAFITIEVMAGAKTFYRVVVDETQHTITLSPFTPPRGATTPQSTAPPVVLQFRMPEADGLAIEGTYQGRSIKARLRRIDESQFLLLNRGFRWINETPYNAAVPRKTSTLK